MVTPGGKISPAASPAWSQVKIAAGNAGESAKCSNFDYMAPIRRSLSFHDKFMDRAKKTTNRAILKGRLSGQPFCVHLLQALAA